MHVVEADLGIIMYLVQSSHMHVAQSFYDWSVHQNRAMSIGKIVMYQILSKVPARPQKNSTVSLRNSGESILLKAASSICRSAGRLEASKLTLTTLSGRHLHAVYQVPIAPLPDDKMLHLQR